jgi:hypothetical protein
MHRGLGIGRPRQNVRAMALIEILIPRGLRQPATTFDKVKKAAEIPFEPFSTLARCLERIGFVETAWVMSPPTVLSYASRIFPPIELSTPTTLRGLRYDSNDIANYFRSYFIFGDVSRSTLFR